MTSKDEVRIMKLSLFGKKKTEKFPYDPEVWTPVIKSSICTGEKTAGFKNRKTGHIEEVALIISDRDLQEFRETYGLKGNIETVY